MVNVNHNNDNSCNVNFPQSTAYMKSNQINSLKISAKNSNSKFLGNDSSQVLLIYHQNICGLGSKTHDLLTSLYPKLPHILCLTEKPPKAVSNTTYNNGRLYSWSRI